MNLSKFVAIFTVVAQVLNFVQATFADLLPVYVSLIIGFVLGGIQAITPALQKVFGTNNNG